MSKRVMLMQDARNGIFPVIVFLPNGKITEDTWVRTIYPFGGDEYTGTNRFGRYIEPDDEEKRHLVVELLILRYIISKLTGNTKDRNFTDDIMKNPEIEKAGVWPLWNSLLDDIKFVENKKTRR